MLQSMGLQSRTHLSNCPELNGNNDTENRFVDTVGEGEVKMNSESNREIHSIFCNKLNRKRI